MLSDFVWPFIKKILPWTLLIMFISFGVAIITGFGQVISTNGQIGDSYLYRYTTGNYTYYTFKANEYVNGLNFNDIFRRWAEIGNNFKQTWNNMTLNSDFTGNQSSKWWKSLLNGIILIPNMLSNIINTLVLLPLQLISQLCTVVLRILGQQVNENSKFWIGQILYNINTWQGIPQIPYVTI